MVECWFLVMMRSRVIVRRLRLLECVIILSLYMVHIIALVLLLKEESS